MLVRVVVLFAVFTAVGCGKKQPEAVGDPPQGHLQSAETDEQKVQGRWALVGVEMTDGPDPEPAELSQFQFQVKGSLLSSSKVGRPTLYFTFQADPTAGLKTADFTDCDEKGAPLDDRDRTDIRGIYKFEGDELVIALAVEGSKRGYRPTEFKASRVVGDGPGKGHMVAVLRLKKAGPNEPVVPGVRPKPKTSDSRRTQGTMRR